MKKTLLGSTALVAAGLMAGPAFAQLELSISGSVDVHMGYADEDLDTDRREYGITTDTTLNFNADGVADNGLEYGTRINVDDNSDAFKIDETYVFVRGGFGAIRFGADDPAASTLRFAIPAVGNGQADGDFGRYLNDTNDGDLFGTDFVYSSDDNKIIYIGEFGDFTLGASYSPTDDSIADDPAQSDNDLADLEDIFSIGGNYQGEFSGVSVGISAGYQYGDFEDTGVGVQLDDLSEYGAAFELGFGAFTFGGLYILSETEIGDTDADLDRYGVGATYSTGPWAFAANALFAEADIDGVGDDPEDQVFGVGVEYALADGLTPYADLVFFDFDETGTANDNDGSVFLVGIAASF